MTKRTAMNDELAALTDRACDGVLTEQDVAKLEEILRGNSEAQRYYLTHVGINRCLLWEFARQSHEPEASAASQFPSIVPSVGARLDGAFGYFSSGWPVAYLVAMAIFGIGILIGWAYHVSIPQSGRQDIANIGSRLAPSNLHRESDMVFVGRVTDMSDDCRWADPKTATIVYAHVPLGRKYSLASGLMKITYDSGARVILQGPCTYVVDSKTGGNLALGRLTARVTKKGEGGRGTGEGSRTTSNPIGESRIAASPSSLHRPPSPFPLPPSAFVVRTPTAVVTDLGTEFGVEVNKEGHTTSHVFRGTVQVQSLSTDGKPEGAGTVLHENQTARFDGRSGDRIAILASSAAEQISFVREMPRRTTKAFDLVDVVAGGNGFYGLRNRGIDPTNGQIATDQAKVFFPGSDGKYHRVEGISFVDGIFIPKGRDAAVQLDSAGHAFATFNNSDDTTGSADLGRRQPQDNPAVAAA